MNKEGELLVSGKRWVALGIAFALFVFSIGVSALSSASTASFTEWFDVAEEEVWLESTVEKGNGQGKIVVLYVNGIIQEGFDGPSLFEPTSYNHRNFLSMLRQANEDHTVDGIIIRINSPGGGVVESSEVHDLMVELKAEYDKPMYVSMGNMAASGGYYISAPADKIFANEATITGSLGVIMQSTNISELAETYGIKTETIKSGAHKDIMSPMREMTEGERDFLQSIVDDFHQTFVDVIVQGRNMDEAVVKEIADGRIYSGKQALELGLVDQLGNFNEVVEVLREEIGRGEIDVVEYETSLGFSSLFTMTVENIVSSRRDPLGIKQLLHESNSPTLMYLYKVD